MFAGLARPLPAVRRLDATKRRVRLADSKKIPDESVYRLSLYHCHLGERIRLGTLSPLRITSRELAQELDVREETVRRDLSFIGSIGRPGAGYDPREMFDALQRTLGLRDEYPIVKVGSAQMLAALRVFFPPLSYGLTPVAYFSEHEDDVGALVNDIEVQHVTEIPDIDRSLGVSVALVACSQPEISRVLKLLFSADVTGVLLLTPMVKFEKPEGMTITHVRMPCDIKSLACRCSVLANR